MNDELGVLSRLIEFLKKEHESIVTFDLKLLTETYKHKYECLKELDALEASRRDNLGQASRFLGWKGPDPFPSFHWVAERLEGETGERLLHLLSCLRSMVQAARELNNHQQQYLAYSLADVDASLRLIETVQGKRIPCYDRSGCMTESPTSQAGTAIVRSV